MIYKNILLLVVLPGILVIALNYRSERTQKLSKEALENFQLVDNFKKDKGDFKRDTLDVSDVSVNGGQAVFYYSKNKNYSVFDLQLFDETGKLHYLFFTDTKLTLKITIQIEQVYNASKQKKEFREKATTTYYSIEGNSFNAYNAERKPITDIDKHKKDKIDKLFKIVKEKK